jgi:CheY-like chemotaxis protein
MFKIWVIDGDVESNNLAEMNVSKSDLYGSYRSFTDPYEALVNLIDLLNVSEKLPDFILLDIQMARSSGWNFLNLFHRIEQDLGKKVSVLIVTSSNRNLVD